MAQLFLGALSFAIAFAFDWASWLRMARLKPLLGLAAGATLATALGWTLMSPGRYRWPAWTSFVGWPLLLASTVLLVNSLFIEIPFAATYARPGVGDRLITTGTYALVRHPGVLWFALWMLAWVLVSRVRLMLVAAVTWSLLNILYVWLQEKLLFWRMFLGYAAYQKETPMLVPTLRSLRQCLRTWPLRQNRTD